MAAEFKISKLRYTWVGPWEPGTVYPQDSVVSYGGQAWVCLVGGITSSSNFYTDLNASPDPVWLQMTHGSTWSGSWEPNTYYNLNSVVAFGGNVYICTTAYTSTSNFSTDFAGNYWSMYLSADTFAGSWSINTEYSVNQIVIYGGIIYKCEVAHTSAATTSSGLEDNQSDWAIWYSGVEYLGFWQGNYRYKLNDLVKVNSNIYICTAGHTSPSTFSVSTDWAMWLPGQEFDLSWSQTTIYQIGDAVVYGGGSYVSKTSNNTGNIPSVDGIDWAPFNVGFKIKSNWQQGTDYVTGDVVNRHGVLFEATSNNSQDPSSTSFTYTYSSSGSSGNIIVLSITAGLLPGMRVIGTGFTSGQFISSVLSGTTITLDRAPDGTLSNGQNITFVGINSNYWKMLIPGNDWLGFWNSATSYVIGDQVAWINNTYTCIQDNLNISPDSDTTNNYWVVTIAHDQTNSMRALGDMETFTTGPSNSQIPIGANGYELMVQGNVPNWKKMNVIPTVYYVDSYIGTDDLLHGTTWDTPFKTIKYACSIIGKGKYFSNAAALLQSNKGWMITEMYQWMLYQCANSISPFSPTSLFDPFYTQRDAGYIIDSIIYDMERGGNSQTVASTLRWFYYGSQTQLANSIIESAINYFAPPLVYLQSLMIDVVNQTAPSISYQTANGITGSNYVNQNLTGNQSESGAVTEITSLMNIPITALTNQNTYLVPTSNSGLTAILNIKTGTYNETLPIVVPENVSIVGDELRGVAVQPAVSLEFYATATTTQTNVVTVTSTTGLADQMPIQFITPYVNNVSTSFEGSIIPGQTYYIQGSSITPTSFKILDAQTVVFTGTTIENSNVVSNVSQITNLSVGMYIAGNGIPTGATISSITQSISSIASITISAPATSSGIFQTFTATGHVVELAGGTGSMLCYAGDCLKDMWYMTNGTTMRNLTNFGLLGMLSAQDAYGLSRPTGGRITSLNPGNGPDDSTVWIIRRSPYVQNVTNFGTGCIGTMADGTLHNGGSKSMLHNDYTQVLSDGIGVWIANSGAISECVSVFSYYCYIGHFASGGGRIRSTNGNSSYGTFGVVSEGYDINEIPGTGQVFNQSTQVQASVSDAFGTAAQLIKLNFINAGSNYYSPATNMLAYSNAFLTSPWSNDGNVSFIKNELAPTGYTEAWLLTGAQSTAGTNYIQQSININPSGAQYTGVSPSTLTGAGSGASLTITVAPGGYSASVTSGGILYQVGNTLSVAGATLGGITGTNDCVLTVATVSMASWVSSGPATSGTYYYYFNPVYSTSNYYLATSTGTFGTTPPTLAQNLTSGTVTLQYVGTYTTSSSTNVLVGTLQTVTVAGVVPAGTSQNYTLSLYVYPGTSPTIDIQAIFSGSSTKVSGISYNVNSNVVTPYAGTALANSTNAGMLPTTYGAEKTLVAGWYRVWFAVNDTVGLNNVLTYKLFPCGANAPTSNTYSVVYGAQAELSSLSKAPNFYLETTNGMYTAYANYEVTGAGSGANLSGDEIRSGSVFNTRIITDSNGYTGGYGYITSNGNAQTGDTRSIQLSQSDAGTSNYINMRVLVQSGTGAGQYGWIAYYNKSATTDTNGVPGRTALVLKESVDTVNVIATVYNATPSQNYLTMQAGTDVSRLYVNQQVQFVPTYFNTTVLGTSISTVTAVATIGGTTNTIQVDNGAPLALNMPIIFTTLSGSGFNITPNFVYYITSITGNYIQIATSLSGDAIQLTNVTIGIGTTMSITYPSYTGYLMASTSDMVPNIPVEFTGVALGGITLGSTYYIQDIIDANNFVISGTQVSITVTGSIGGSTNTIQTSSTATLIPCNPITFTGTTFDAAISTSVTYYISSITDSGDFQIASSIIRTTATSTQYSTNLIQIGSSVTDFVIGQPIIFSGIPAGQSFGGIFRETIYYILTTNTSNNQITISTDGVNPVSLTNATGQIYVRTCPAAYVLGGGTGSMTANSTGTRIVVTNNIGLAGTMTATYSLTLIGGVNSYTRYYITSIAGSNITVSTTLAGTPITLINGTGSMQMGACGWDNFNPGTPPAAALDSQSIYYIEPRIQYSLPSWSQITGTSSVTLSGTSWQAMAYGNNHFLALPASGSIGGQSTDGNTWSSLSLPSTIANWTSIAYGNFYWVALGSTSGGNSLVAYSNANGASWHTSALPANYPGSWNKIAYGNGIFVAIATGVTQSSTVAETASASKQWQAIAYGNGKYIAIAADGTTGTSVNGTSWTAGPSLSSSYTWNDITFGSGTFLAVSSASSGTPISAYTTNGVTWINGGSMGVSAGQFLSVTNNGQGTWVSPAYGTSSVAVSTNNGLAWTLYSMPSVANWTDIDFGNGLYVALAGGTASTTAAYSVGYGAQTWVASTLPVSTIWTNIAYGNGTFVALAANGTTAYDVNGINWTVASGDAFLTGTVSPNWTNLRYGNGHFFAQDTGGSVAATSIDGKIWQGLTMPSTQQWVDAAFNTSLNNWVAISGGTVASTAFALVQITGPAAYSNNFGYTWNLSTTGLLTNKVWVDLKYGDQEFLAIASDGTTARSPDGNTWVGGQLPTASTTFSSVTINSSAGSISFTASPIQLYPGMTIVVTGENTGAGTIINGTYYIYSTTNGATQATLSSTYPSYTAITTVAGTTSGLLFSVSGVPNYTGLAWGNSRFVAIQSGLGLFPAYSFDGSIWYQGLTYHSATSIAYGNGAFVAVQNSGTVEYSSDSGVYWYQRALTYGSIAVIGYGFDSSNVGKFPTLSNTGGTLGDVTTIYEGIRPQGRAQVTSNVITRITQWEPGSNYPSAVTGYTTVNSATVTQVTNASNLYAGLTVTGTGIPVGTTIISVGTNSFIMSANATATSTSAVTITPAPTVTFSDFNAQIVCEVQARSSNGVLSNPTFVNRGTGYNTTSTAITISGNGFADTYQIGYTLICNNLQSVPEIGSNIVIEGVSQVYKVTSAYAVYGTVAPFIEANIQISPEMTTEFSPATGTPITIRQLYSQVRLTNHDFLSIGVGNAIQTNYPNVDESTAKPQNEAVEANQGHVFYVSTDENGNFEVGSLFGVEQSTGEVTLSATQFGLIGLATLSLGGLAVGSSSVIINQISTDPAFTANSDAIIPTQRAIKSYITGRLSQGGANTFTGQLIAGTVEVGNPNFIQSTIPPAITGSSIKMVSKVYINGKGVDGNMAALDFFARNAFHRSTALQN